LFRPFSVGLRIAIKLFPQCHHMSLMDFVVSPLGCGRGLTDFWGWDAVTLSRWGGWWYMNMKYHEGP
jgi:hypothetical protein